jgi:hypothetical protein
MGYKPPKTVYKLDFSETEHPGLEVTIRSGSIEKLLDLQDLAERDDLAVAEVKEMFTQFAAMLVEWNVEDDDDKPVPTTYAGVATQEPEFIKAIITAWQANTTQAPPPLPGGSQRGSAPPEASLPMEALPANPPS